MDEEDDKKKKSGFLKKVFTMGVIGTAITFGGMALMPFFTASAGTAIGTAQVAGTTVSNGQAILGHWYQTFFTGADGTTGLSAGLSKMWLGAKGVGVGIWDTGAQLVSNLSSGQNIADAAINAVNADHPFTLEA